LSNLLVNFREYIYLKLLLPEAFFQPKMHKTAFGGRVQPGPAGGAYSAPQTLAGLRGLEGDVKGVEGVDKRGGV